MGAAEGHDRGGRPPSAASFGRQLLVPPASGPQCARVLRRAGFDIRTQGPDHVVALRDGIRVVTIPLVDRLRPELLVAILRTAGVSVAEFVRNLDDD